MNDFYVDRKHVLATYPDAEVHCSFGTLWWVEVGYAPFTDKYATEQEAWFHAANRVTQQRVDAATNDLDKIRARLESAGRCCDKIPEWKRNVLLNANKASGPRRDPIWCEHHTDY